MYFDYRRLSINDKNGKWENNKSVNNIWIWSFRYTTVQPFGNCHRMNSFSAHSIETLRLGPKHKFLIKPKPIHKKMKIECAGVLQYTNEIPQWKKIKTEIGVGMDGKSKWFIHCCVYCQSHCCYLGFVATKNVLQHMAHTRLKMTIICSWPKQVIGQCDHDHQRTHTDTHKRQWRMGGNQHVV